MSARLTNLAASLPATVPFTGPEALERQTGRPFLARLGANESVFGPSPMAIAAMARVAAEAWKYGDPECHDLKAALARHHGITPAHIVAGEGIDGLLGLIVRLTIAPGDAAVMPEGGYPTFAFHVTGFGGALHRVPYRNDAPDPAALIGKAQETGAKLLYLSNPDNPMGGQLAARQIEDMAANLPDGTLLILDEAYADLATAPLPRIAADHPGVIRFRTFSKAHGLAGLRIGYGIGPAGLIPAFDRVRNHFGLGLVAQAAALAALNDHGWIANVRMKAAAARDRLAAIAAANGLVALPSATNFVTMDFGRDGAFARAALDALQARGVFVRMPGTAPLDRCIRVSLGDDAALSVFESALPEALRAARPR